MEPLRDEFGDVVTLDYTDISKPEADQEIVQEIQRRGLPYPLTFINGTAVSAGFISYYDIATKVDDILRSETN